MNSEHPKVFSFLRNQGPWRNLIFANWSTDITEFEIPEEINTDLAVLLISNYEVKEDILEHKVKLRPYEARTYTLRN